ncbi:MAG: hypothetical protein ACRCV6_01850 [Formosimonas sp.]
MSHTNNIKGKRLYSLLFLPLNVKAKLYFSWAMVLLTSIGLTLSLFSSSLLDKKFQSNKEILDLMYLQGETQINGEDFMQKALKIPPAKYCTNIVDQETQKNCRLTLYKAQEINWLTDKFTLYLAFSAITAFGLLSLSCFCLARRFFSSNDLPFYISIAFFSTLNTLFLLLLNS